MNEQKKLKLLMHNPLLLTGAVLFLLVLAAALFADVIAPFHYAQQNLSMKLSPPGGDYLLGTDQYGRCIFSRILYGSRIALSVGLIAVVIETVIGVSLGILAGFYGKTVDKAVMFLTDMTWAIPPIILALAIVIILGPSSQNVAISIAVVSWAQFTKIVRAKVQSMKDLSYIEAARVYGESDLNLILRYILPNLVPTIVILASLALPAAILSTTSRGFLGLGAQQPQPDWGLILSEGIQYIKKAPWISIYPGFAIVWTVLSFNLVGEGLKAFLDPRMKL